MHGHESLGPYWISYVILFYFILQDSPHQTNIKLTISWDNSILVLSCSFKVGKYISECWPRWNFLWALANTFFYDVTIKLYYCQKRWYFKFNFRKNTLHQQKPRKKLNIRHLNGHLDFSSGFQVIDRSNYEKMLKSCKKPGH